MLLPAIARIAARFGKVPVAVTADRGYGEAAVEAPRIHRLRGITTPSGLLKGQG
jgi:2-methylisocitrate lyase-like PEP mutase family enzyme